MRHRIFQSNKNLSAWSFGIQTEIREEQPLLHLIYMTKTDHWQKWIMKTKKIYVMLYFHLSKGNINRLLMSFPCWVFKESVGVFILVKYQILWKWLSTEFKYKGAFFYRRWSFSENMICENTSCKKWIKSSTQNY